MSVFHDFEQKALRMLISPVFGPATVDLVMREASSHRTVLTSKGYEVEVSHPELPAGRSGFDSPAVIGEAGKFTVRFTAEIDNGLLRLLCESVNGGAIPASFRQQDVTVSRGDQVA